MKDTKRRKPRFVEIDQGYGHAEHLVRGRVITSRQAATLFGPGTKEEILVEMPGGERVWAAYWRECSPIEATTAAGE